MHTSASSAADHATWQDVCLRINVINYQLSMGYSLLDATRQMWQKLTISAGWQIVLLSKCKMDQTFIISVFSFSLLLSFYFQMQCKISILIQFHWLSAVWKVCAYKCQSWFSLASVTVKVFFCIFSLPVTSQWDWVTACDSNLIFVLWLLNWCLFVLWFDCNFFLYYVLFFFIEICSSVCIQYFFSVWLFYLAAFQHNK